MIEVNLIPVKRRISFEIAGIDLRKVNVPFLLLAALIYLLRPVVEQQWKDQKDQVRSKIETSNTVLRNIKSKGRELKEIDKQIGILEEQERKLNEKFNAVKKVIQIKKSPLNILLYASKNIPEDVWIEQFIFGNERLKMEGFSASYRSIGIFVENLKKSLFFGSSVKLDDSRTVTDEVSGKRKERFEISAIIQRYE